ncbi:MAG: hypothetical protein IPK31_05045 [Chitinophagaceae bacterium]|nr:hypothetical protein [Chitinophagaceae bacterium]
MTILFVKLYEEYKRVNAPDPEGRLVLYATYFTLMSSYAIFLPLWNVIEAILFDGRIGVNPIFLLAFSLIICVVGYKFIYKKLFRQNKMGRLQEKYQHYSINRVLLYFIVVTLPIFQLFLGMSIGIILTGGEILGTRFQGLIR